MRGCFPYLPLLVMSAWGSAFSLAAPPMASAGEEVSKSVYSFAFLGDLHFDQLDHHDMDWVRENYPGDVRQIENYSRVTSQNSGALLKVVSDTLTHSISPYGILQAGDLVEGLCGNYGLQARQFNDAIDFVESAVAPFPFLVTKGNHDITGPGAEAAFRDVLLPYLGKQLGVDIDSPSYLVRQGHDLFVFFDAYKPDLNWLEEVLMENDARYVFLVVHEPVVPYNARSQWHLFSRDPDSSRRKRLCSLLGEHHVIVLSGHLHHYSAVRRKTENGFFVQLSMNSVVNLHSGSFALVEGTDGYGPDLIDLEPEFAPDTRQARRDVLEKEKPWIEFFELAKTPAWALVTVSDESIDVDLRLRSESTIWRSLHIERSKLGITRKANSFHVR